MAKKPIDPYWNPLSLSSEDQRLVDAYIEVGKPLDRLPYSDDFEKLMEKLGDAHSPEKKYHVFQRLLLLRKKGQLPSIGKYGVEY